MFHWSPPPWGERVCTRMGGCEHVGRERVCTGMCGRECACTRFSLLREESAATSRSEQELLGRGQQHHLLERGGGGPGKQPGSSRDMPG